jgi:hypothetical protein
MNQLCLLTNLSSSDIAAWAQAIVSSIAIIVGAFVVFWQTRRARLEQTEREARVLDGIAYLLIHLKESANEARAEKKKLERLPLGHPAEPSARFKELTESIHRFPLEAAQGAVPIEALLVSRRVANELLPLVGPEPELDVNPDYEHWFHEYIRILDRQILFLQDEAKRLMKGKRVHHAVVQNEK